MTDSGEIDTARKIAERAHHGQLDKIGVPYIEHPAMVATLVQRLSAFGELSATDQRTVVVAGWLHDVLEDTTETTESLRAAGVSEQAIDTVETLTRTNGLSSDAYYAKINQRPLGRLVKIADLASNLLPDRVAHLDTVTRERLEAKYSHALVALGVDRSVITTLHSSDRRLAR